MTKEGKSERDGISNYIPLKMAMQAVTKKEITNYSFT